MNKAKEESAVKREKAKQAIDELTDKQFEILLLLLKDKQI